MKSGKHQRASQPAEGVKHSEGEGAHPSFDWRAEGKQHGNVHQQMDKSAMQKHVGKGAKTEGDKVELPCAGNGVAGRDKSKSFDYAICDRDWEQNHNDVNDYACRDQTSDHRGGIENRHGAPFDRNLHYKL